MSDDFERGWKDGSREAWWDNFFDGCTEASKEVASVSLKIITFGQWKGNQKEQKKLPSSKKDIVIDNTPGKETSGATTRRRSHE